MSATAELTGFVSRELAVLANPEKARQMAAYMKTDMPFYGVQKPFQAPVFREAWKQFGTGDRATWERNVRALWALPRREEKYAALDYAARHKAFLTPDALSLVEQLVREGAWWDLVDEAANRLLNPITLKFRDQTRPVMDRWIDDESMWVRRAAILSQLKHKRATDAEQLFDYCLRRAHEKEFFIRKAIGWALRQYSRTAPEAVASFLTAHQDRLSALTYREGGRLLRRCRAT